MAKFDINGVINKESKKEIIDEIFMQVYNCKTTYIHNKREVDGFNINLPALSYSKRNELHPLFNVFYNLEDKSKKIMLGDVNTLDVENTLQNIRLFIVEYLNELLDGKFNEKLEVDLRIRNLNDFRILLLDKNLSKKIAGHMFNCVVFKIRHIAESNANPDFAYIWDKIDKKMVYEKINKEYIDKKDENGDTLEIADEVIEEDNSTTFIQYVIENYIHKGALTNKQQQFWNNCLQYGDKHKNLKHVYKNESEIRQYKRQILKRLEQKLGNDENVAFIQGFTTYTWRKTHLMDEYGENIKRRHILENEGRWVLLENYPALKNKIEMGENRDERSA